MDELLGRKVPHSPVAEQSVIGSMLIDIRCIPDVIEKLKADEFYIKINRDIFETVDKMFSFGEKIDPVTVLDQMKVRGVYADGSDSYMAEILRVTPTAANVMEYVEIVKDTALRRRLGDAADKINNMVYDGQGESEAVLEAAEQMVYDLRQGRAVGGLREIKYVMGNVFDNLSELSKNGGQVPGLSTGFPDLDQYILGLNKSEFILIAARPGMGKTSIALNMALYVGMQLKKKVAFFSLEMSREQLTTRLLSRAAMVPAQHLLTGQLSDKEWKDVMEAGPLLANADILIDDNPSLTVSDMNAACRRVPDLGLVCIDYLQLMSSAKGNPFGGGENRTQVVSEISRMLKVMAKELNVPVICLSQLNRSSESRQDKRPMLSDLRESGSIEQDADVVLALYREGYYNKECENPNLVECLVLKNRKGQTGTVNLTWLGEYTAFASYEGNRDDEY